MIWSHPFAFIGLLVVPLVFFFTARYEQKRYVSILNTFSKEMQTKLFSPRSKASSIVKGVFLLCSCLSFVLFLAGPKSATIAESSSPSLGRDIFVILDVSESMNAEDVSPNRLSMAKLHIEDLLETATGNRIGLIAFAGSAQIEVPLTTDYHFYRTILRKLDTTTVKTAGTAIGDAIRLALERFGANEEFRSRVIVLITDGEDHESLPLEAAQNAADAHVPVFTIAIGDINGAKIPVVDTSGRKSFKTYDGETVLSKPDVAGLKEIAKISNGKYFYAGSNLDLANVYKTSIDKLERSELETKSRLQYKDLYQPFLACGTILFAMYYFFPSHLSRRSFQTLTIAVILALFEGVPVLAQGSFNEDINSQPIEKKSLSSGQALKEYNRAMKLFKENQTDEAKKIESSLVDSTNQEVKSRVNYNLAVDSLSRALELSKKLDAPLSKEGGETDVETANAPHNTQSASPDELIAKYNEERKKREETRQDIAQEILNSRQYFNSGTRSKKLGIAASANAEVATNWLLEKQASEQKRETSLRAQALPSPDLQLLWLKSETQESIQELERLSAKALSGSDYQRIFNMSNELSRREHDVNVIADLCVQHLSTAPSSTPAGTPSATTSIPSDPVGAQIIDEARQAFLVTQKNAVEALRLYDPIASRKSLRNAQTKLDVAKDVLSVYPDLAVRLADEENKKANECDKDKLKNTETLALEGMYWDRTVLANSVNELMRKAEGVVSQKNEILATRKKEPQPVNEDQVDLSNLFDADTAVKDVENDEQNVEDAQESSNERLKTTEIEDKISPEEKLLKSAEIALEYRNQLTELIKRNKALLGNDKNQPERLNDSDADEYVKTQADISRILQEIVKPLKDEQNQDQNSNNDNKEDQQKEPKKEEEEDNKDQSESDQVPQDQQDDPKESQKQQDPNSQENKQPQSNESQENKNEVAKDEANVENTKHSQEEQEAEALIRLMERRQKDAEEQRKLIRQLSTKREKFGKDW